MTISFQDLRLILVPFGVPTPMRVETVMMGAEASPEVVSLAVEHGVGAGVFGDGIVSVENLGPDASRLTQLFAGGRRILGAKELERCTSLEVLSLRGSPDAAVDLSRLPRLKVADGTFTTRSISALANPNLEGLAVWGVMPKRLPRVEGRVRDFAHLGGGGSAVLPAFAHPEAMRVFMRTKGARVDIAELAQFQNLEELNLRDCTIVNVAAFASFTRLQRIKVWNCTAEEGWDDLPTFDGVPAGHFAGLKPALPRTWRERHSDLEGWLIGLDNDDDVPHFTPILPEDDDENEELDWYIYESDFSWLDQVFQDLGRGLPDAYGAEDLLDRMVTEMRESGLALAIRWDSESAVLVAYFPSEHDANLFATHAKALMQDPARQRRLLVG